MEKNRILGKPLFERGDLVALDIYKYANTDSLREIQNHWINFEPINTKFPSNKYRLNTRFVGEKWKNLQINIVLDILKPEDVWRQSVILGLHHRWPKNLDISEVKIYLVFSQYYGKEYLLLEEEMKKVM